VWCVEYTCLQQYPGRAVELSCARLHYRRIVWRLCVLIRMPLISVRHTPQWSNTTPLYIKGPKLQFNLFRACLGNGIAITGKTMPPLIEGRFDCIYCLLKYWRVNRPQGPVHARGRRRRRRRCLVQFYCYSSSGPYLKPLLKDST
jgi:hypothetical protein